MNPKTIFKVSLLKEGGVNGGELCVELENDNINDVALAISLEMERYPEFREAMIDEILLTFGNQLARKIIGSGAISDTTALKN